MVLQFFIVKVRDVSVMPETEINPIELGQLTASLEGGLSERDYSWKALEVLPFTSKSLVSIMDEYIEADSNGTLGPDETNDKPLETLYDNENEMETRDMEEERIAGEERDLAQPEMIEDGSDDAIMMGLDTGGCDQDREDY